MRRSLVVVALAVLAGCGTRAEDPRDQAVAEPEVAAGDEIAKTTTVGPVKATVTVRPAEPVIGDVMALSLIVESQDGVVVEMPAFQEVLSRFSIEKQHGDEGSTDGLHNEQHYRLQAASSGRLRIPPLRIVFTDKRPGQESSNEERELLTEEISIKVATVLPDETANTLQPVRRTLEVDLGPSFWQRYWWAFVAGLVCVLSGIAVLMVRRTRKVVEISPYERASVALARLEAQGLPDAGIEAWYVGLSGIVRRYLEDRFGLRAPELTTEEFLRVAQRSARVSNEHKVLLTDFLVDCDRVKFAGYEPGAEESDAVLEAARRFLLETREVHADASETRQDVPVANPTEVA